MITSTGFLAKDGCRIPIVRTLRSILGAALPLWFLSVGLGEEKGTVGPFTTRLPTTRLYVSSPWEVEAEVFYKGVVPRHGRPAHFFQTEVEIGLPGRLQIGINEGLVHEPGDRLRHDEVVFETRFAFAAWGRVPLNPAIFAEWHLRERDSDAYEFKLLLAEEIGGGWLWACNATFEHEVSGGLESEAGFSQALLYSVIPSKLYLGAEMTLTRPIARGGHGKPEVELAIGPSIAWRLCEHAELKVAPLIGVTSHAPQLEIAVLVGIDF